MSEIEIQLPKDLNLYLTSKCNFKCAHCFRRIAEPTAQDVTVDLIDEIFKVYPIQTVCLAGFGEPLFTPEIIDIIEYLNERGVKPGLITNGSKLTEYVDKLAKKQLVYLSVSLNECGATSHELTTGTKTFAEILKGILKLKEKASYPIGISKVCFSGKLEAIPNFIKLGTYLNVDFIQLTNNLPYSNEVLPGIITERDKGDLRFLRKCIEISEAKRVTSWPTVLKKKCPHTCNSPWHSIGINGDGFITGCRRVYGADKKFGHFSNSDNWALDGTLGEIRKGVRGRGEYANTCFNCFGNYK